MKFTLTGRHLEITPYLKAHVDEKVQKLAHFNDRILEAEVVLSKDRVNHVAEGKVLMGHAVLTAKGLGADLYIAVNDLMDKLLHQLQRHDGKLRDRKRQNHETPPA